MIAQLYERALALHRRGDLVAARGLYEKILRADARHAKALQMLGTAALQAGDLQTGIALVRESLQIDPAQPAAYSALGNALRSSGRSQEALEMFDRALHLDPEHSPAHNNRGSALVDLGRFEEAIESYERALRLMPDHFGALVNKGNALLRAQRFEPATASFQHALRLRPDSAAALFGYGEALQWLRRFDESLLALQRALAIEPNHSQGWLHCGCVLHELRRLDEAVVSHQRAISLEPRDALPHFELGSVLLDLGRVEEAAACFAEVVRINPDFPYAIGRLLQARMQQCDWRDWQQEVDRVVAAVDRGIAAAYPIVLLAAADLPLSHLKLARTTLVGFTPPAAAFGPHEHRRLRVAYLSADFRDHPVSLLLAGVLESHAREHFEVVAVALQPPDDSALAQRIRAAADRFLDVSRLSDEVVADALRRMEVDIAVDLQGMTQGMREGIFAWGAAPVQLNFLGFPGTLGSPYMDYIIADRIVIPEGAEDAYSERIVRLPHSFMPFDNRQEIAERTPTRAEEGLPPEGFVFCGFNNHIKITPAQFDVWMRLLRAVPGSCLWLRWAGEPVVRNLRREARSRGVEPERLVFARRVPAMAEHLARHRLADLFLDSLPYNAHATAAYALWAGLPVLTCQGAAFAGRVGASLLRAVGLPELITGDWAEYERLALELAGDPARLGQLRARLANQRLTAPLFDTLRYCRDLEAAFLAIVERRRRGEPPSHLDIATLRE